MKWLFEKNRWRRARKYLDEHKPLLIGVTGSSQKSLTIEALRLALQNYRHTHVVEKPADIVELALPAPQTIIAKASATKPGDIDTPARELPFQMAVVTNINSQNLDVFGTKDLVAHEYTSLVSALSPSGHAILNSDDPLVDLMRNHTQANSITYGTSKRAAVRLVRSVQIKSGGFIVEVAADGRHYQLAVPGLITFSQLYAPLAALAVAYALDENLEQVLPLLAQLHPMPGELSLATRPNGPKILDATAGATPETMLAALHTLRTWPATRRIAILGDITNLGSETVSAHKRIGRAAAESAQIFIAVGEAMRHAGGQALLRRPGPDVHHFNSSAEVGEWLAPYLTPSDIVLVMGSPEMKLEAVIHNLGS